ncbi:ATP-binding protein [Catenuloplanes indicus]|nr:ATP-binding protein [Catenuloplanes indicus]
MSEEDPGPEATEPDRGPVTVAQDLFPLPGASLVAREVVTEACMRWGLPDAVAPASLIVSELVANVVDHAHTSMTLEIALRPGRLLISMRDGSRVPPMLRRDTTAPSARGRGLLLIEAVSADWGYRLDAAGKTVWTALEIIT